MPKDPAFLFYVSDFLTGTMFFTDEQVGIYIRLLCSQHQHGGLIEKETFESIVGKHGIIKSKFIETEDGFMNQRLAGEMERRAKKSCNLSANAKQRWSEAMQKQCKSNAIALQKHTNRHMPIENENESIILNESFEVFWSNYPKRVKRKDALKSWLKLKPSKELTRTIIESIIKWKNTESWQKDNGQYIPLPTSFLNGERWKDEIPKPKTNLPPIFAD